MGSPFDTAKSAILGSTFNPDHKPDPLLTVQAFSEFQTQLEASQSGALVKSTLADLNALTEVSEPSVMAWVTNDDERENNGIYENTGTANTPAWTRRTSIPQFVVAAINSGAGTANAIQADTDVSIPTENGRCLIILNITVDNTDSTTVSFNGGLPLTIKNILNALMTEGALKANMIVCGFISNNEFKLISDTNSASIAVLNQTNTHVNDIVAVPERGDVDLGATIFVFVPTATNTGAMTLDIAGTQVDLRVTKGVDAIAGDVIQGRQHLIHKDGSEYIISTGLTTTDKAIVVAAKNDVETAASAASMYDGNGLNFDTVADLLSDTVMTYTAGDNQVTDGQLLRVIDGGYAYKVAATTATDNHLITVGGVKLYVLMENVAYVAAFGAKGDGVTDDTIAIQKAFDAVGTKQEQQPQIPILFSPKNYIISDEIVSTSENISVLSFGVARISCTDPTKDFSIFNFTKVGRANIENITFYMYGSDCKGVSGRLWRQSSLNNCKFVGGAVGLDLTSGNDVWGIDINDCYFDGCVIGIDAHINGQTFKISNTKFINTKAGGWALRLEDGSQINIDTCVFEKALGVDRGRSMKLTDCKEVTLIGVQTETLGVTSTHTGVVDNYDVQIYNSNVNLIGCRFWGGGFGAVEPGNSREYGVYLDATSNLTLNNSRIYSYRKVALWSVEGSTLTTDLMSQLDFRCVKGNPTFICNSDLGKNLINNSDFVYEYGAATKIIPLGFNRTASNGSQLAETDTFEKHVYAALDLTGSVDAIYSNPIDVTAGEWISWRFIYKRNAYITYEIRDPDNSNAVLFTGEVFMTASENNAGLIANCFQVPAGVTRIHIYIRGSSYIEGLAAYRIKINVNDSAAIYSNNDGSFGCKAALAPPLPFKKSKNLNTWNKTSTTWAGPFKNGAIVHYDSDVITSAAATKKIYYNGSWTEV